MLQEIAQSEVLPFKYILADSIYGNSSDFVGAARKLIGKVYFVSISSATLCWIKTPGPPVKVSDFAKSLGSYYWYKRTVSEGAKGPISYEFTKRRITLCEDGRPGKVVWLIIRRHHTNAKSEYSYFISNAPISSRLNLFVWLSGLRWAIEQCFEETKTELGMDHYEVRKFRGWHQHILTCILAHYFLWHLKIRLGKKSTVHYHIAA